MRLRWIVPAILILAGLSRAQEPVTTLRLGTRVVSVSAVVLDSHGLPVRDLPKEDFALKQDGKPQEIRYFSEDSDLPLTLSLLVDTSGSEKAYLEEEVMDSEVFFKAMMRRPTDRSALYQFDVEARKVQGLTPSVQTLINSLNFLTMPRGATMDATRGGTKLYDAVVAAALASEGRDRGRRALVLLTDGEDVGSRATLEQAIAAAQRADVVVYAVLIGAPEPSRSHAPAPMSRGSDVLRNISSATGGRLFTLANEMNLKDAFELIEEDLRLQYQIGYTPPETKAGSYHKIELKVQGAPGKVTIQARRGFYTPE